SVAGAATRTGSPTLVAAAATLAGLSRGAAAIAPVVGGSRRRMPAARPPELGNRRPTAASRAAISSPEGWAGRVPSAGRRAAATSSRIGSKSSDTFGLLQEHPQPAQRSHLGHPHRAGLHPE